MNDKTKDQGLQEQQSDLLGDSRSLELTQEGLTSVKKDWGKKKRNLRDGHRQTLVLTTKDILRTTRVPRSTSRHEKVLTILHKPFQKVFSIGQAVVAVETDTGKQILNGGHLAHTALMQNGYCLAIIPTSAELKTLKSLEYKLLYASFYHKHKKRERKELVREWLTYHSKGFRNEDITRNLGLLFNVTARTIYNDLKEISNV